jgi:hypothetical protein
MASKKCPMCGTKNDQSAKSCSFCGYIFEDYNTSGASATTTSKQDPTPAPQISNSPSTTSYSSAPLESMAGIPIFSVSKSFVSTLIPTIVYLVFMLLIVVSTGFSIFSLVIIVIFLLIPTATTLFTPNRFEFYEDYMRTHKPVGGDTEYPYSELEIYNYPNNRRKERIYLSVSGNRKLILVPKNPENKERNQDLKQFLETKLKKRDDTAKNESTTQEQTETEDPEPDQSSTS